MRSFFGSMAAFFFFPPLSSLINFAEKCFAHRLFLPLLMVQLISHVAKFQLIGSHFKPHISSSVFCATQPLIGETHSHGESRRGTTWISNVCMWGQSGTNTCAYLSASECFFCFCVCLFQLLCTVSDQLFVFVFLFSQEL